MKIRKLKIDILFIVFILTNCAQHQQKGEPTIQEQRLKLPVKPQNYDSIINTYLNKHLLKPTSTLQINDDKNKIEINQQQVSWKIESKGLQISINENIISTAQKTTLNNVWGNHIDSVYFANFINQINYYENDSLLGFILSNNPCTGLGCNVDYYLVYDLKTNKESYFGTYRTGAQFELFDFENDNNIDYVAKTYHDSGVIGVDTTEYVLFSQSNKGDFVKFINKKQQKFRFRYAYSQSDSSQFFIEEWIEKIVE